MQEVFASPICPFSAVKRGCMRDVETLCMWLIETDHRLEVLNDETFTLKLNPTFCKLGRWDFGYGLGYFHNVDALDFQHPLVAAPFGRASAVLRGTVWSGSSAR